MEKQEFFRKSLDVEMRQTLRENNMGEEARWRKDFAKLSVNSKKFMRTFTLQTQAIAAPSLDSRLLNKFPALVLVQLSPLCETRGL